MITSSAHLAVLLGAPSAHLAILGGGGERMHNAHLAALGEGGAERWVCLGAVSAAQSMTGARAICCQRWRRTRRTPRRCRRFIIVSDCGVSRPARRGERGRRRLRLTLAARSGRDRRVRWHNGPAPRHHQEGGQGRRGLSSESAGAARTQPLHWRWRRAAIGPFCIDRNGLLAR